MFFIHRQITHQHRQSTIYQVLSKAQIDVPENKDPPRKGKEPCREESLQAWKCLRDLVYAIYFTNRKSKGQDRMAYGWQSHVHLDSADMQSPQPTEEALTFLQSSFLHQRLSLWSQPMASYEKHGIRAPRNSSGLTALKNPSECSNTVPAPANCNPNSPSVGRIRVHFLPEALWTIGYGKFATPTWPNPFSAFFFLFHSSYQ